MNSSKENQSIQGNSKNRESTRDKDKKEKRRLLTILGVIILLLLATISVLAPTIKEEGKVTLPSLPGLDRSIAGNVKGGQDEEGLDPQATEEKLQEEVANNTLNARIASALQPDKEGYVYLSLKNKYQDKLLQVVIENQETGQVYYTSPVLEPDQAIEYDQITNLPNLGSYACIAHFYYYTINEEPISQVGAQIKLIVE